MTVLMLWLVQAVLGAPVSPGSTSATTVAANIANLPDMTPEQKREAALQATAEVDAIIAEVDRLFARTRDTTVQRCVGEKGVSVRKFAAVAKSAQEELVVRLSDAGLADYHLRRVYIALDRVQKLRDAALACTSKRCDPDSSTDAGPRSDDVKQECAQANVDVDVNESTESLVGVNEEDVVVVEPPQASPN